MNSVYKTNSEMLQAFFDSYYQNLSKMEWRGVYFPKRKVALNHQDKKSKCQNELCCQQSGKKISKLLMQSYTYNQIIKIQLSDFNENDIIGEISDYDDDLFYLDDGKKFRLGEIRNVEVVI